MVRKLIFLYIQLQGETAYMSSIGLYDVDYKILVATRTGRLYIFSKSSTSGFRVETTHAIVAVLLRIDKFICCTINGLLQCYTLKVRLYLVQVIVVVILYNCQLKAILLCIFMNVSL